MKNLLNNDYTEIINLNNNFFDIEKLHDSMFKKLLKYYDVLTEAPTDYLLLILLATLSGVIGKNIYWEIANIRIYLNIWGVIIGKSTLMKKSTAVGLIVGILYDIEEKLNSEYEKALEEYKKKELELKNDKKALAELKKPIKKSVLLPQDSTIEALVDILKVNDKGLFFNHEFGGFLKSLNRSYSGDAKQFFTQIYDVVKTYKVTRVVKGLTFVRRPYLAIIGASTIDWIIENSVKSDLRTGFFARFLYVILNNPTKEHIPLFELEEKLSKYQFDINPKEIFERLFDIKGYNKIKITKEAKEIFNEFDREFHKNLYSLENDDELAFKGRLFIYTLKFAGIIALTDNRFIVDVQDIEDAIYLSNYFSKNIEIFIGEELTKDEFSRLEEKALKLIRSEKDKKISRSLLLKKMRIRAKELDEIIDNLEAKEQIKIEEFHIKNSKVINYVSNV